jgi:uncharacterized membrane protein
VLEIARVKIITKQTYWFFVKATLVICGTGIGYVTFITGYLRKADFGSGTIKQLVDMHFYCAIITLVLFSLISLAYLIAWMESGQLFTAFRLSKIWKVLNGFKQFMSKPAIQVSLALIGLALVTITGSLGGALAYGPDVDPFVKFIYNLFLGSK